MGKLKKGTGWLAALLLAIAMHGTCGLAFGASGQPMIEPHAQAMPLLPFLDYLIDPTMTMDVEDAARAPGWQSYISSRLPEEEGALWLRFTIAPISPDAKSQTFLLDMGQSVPGQPALYEPVLNELSGSREWRENLPGQRNILLLPESASEAQPCYIRLDGLPGPWFAPMIRTPQNAAANWGSLARPAAILALCVVMAFCILRGLGETGQWRYWTGLFVAAALGQAILGMPQAGDTFAPEDIAAIMLPGIALMFLPHVGRHLMNSRGSSRSIDIQLFLLSLPGAAIAVLPLVPGWKWLERWVDLWPFAAVIFIPTALGAWMMGLNGGRRFLLACVIMPLAVGVALTGLEFGLPANVLASGPIWGVAIAALILVAASLARAPEEKKDAKPKKDMPQMNLEADPIINLEHPLDDPNLRLIPATDNDNFSMEYPPAPPMPATSCPPVADKPIAPEIEARENALREPADEILREASALAHCSLPPSARQSAERMADACRRLANVLSRPGVLPYTRAGDLAGGEEDVFNLQQVLRNAHDSIAGIAEYSGITLSWYMTPHLGPIFKGDARALEEILRLLLESATRSTTNGVIKLSARRVPESQDNGHILFTVEDDGHGYPPNDRSSLALARAWELAGANGGYLSVDSSSKGSTISFSAHFTPMDDNAEVTTDSPRIILAADSSDSRRQLVRVIEAAGCAIVEAVSPGEVVDAQMERPAALLICQGSFAKPSSADMVRKFRSIARKAGFMRVSALAITADDRQWALLKASGFTHAMLEPVDPDVLQRTVRQLSIVHMEPESEREGNLEVDNGSGEAGESVNSQDMNASAIFDGPEWLLGEVFEEETGENGISQTPGVENGGHVRHVPKGKIKFEPTRMNGEQQGQSEFGEWVGEPMPIGAPVTAPNDAEKPKNDEAASEDVEKPEDAAEQANEAGEEGVKPDAAMDEIPQEPPAEAEEAIANEGVQADAEGAPETSAPAGEPRASVMDFVHSSVNMVADTLSSMLRQGKSGEKQEEAPQEVRAEYDAQSDPEILGLLARVDEAMMQATAAFKANNGPAVATATGIIGRDAEEFGLRRLGRIANSVERAARANNLDAVGDLLPDLEVAVERNRLILSQEAKAKSGEE